MRWFIVKLMKCTKIWIFAFAIILLSTHWRRYALNFISLILCSFYMLKIPFRSELNGGGGGGRVHFVKHWLNTTAKSMPQICRKVNLNLMPLPVNIHSTKESGAIWFRIFRCFSERLLNNWGEKKNRPPSTFRRHAEIFGPYTTCFMFIVYTKVPFSNKMRHIIYGNWSKRSQLTVLDIYPVDTIFYQRNRCLADDSLNVFSDH